MEGLGIQVREHDCSRVPSSREALEWAAHHETPILTVDDVEAGPDSVEIDPQVHVTLAASALHEAQVWKLDANS